MVEIEVFQLTEQGQEPPLPPVKWRAASGWVREGEIRGWCFAWGWVGSVCSPCFKFLLGFVFLDDYLLSIQAKRPTH